MGQTSQYPPHPPHHPHHHCRWLRRPRARPPRLPTPAGGAGLGRGLEGPAAPGDQEQVHLLLVRAAHQQPTCCFVMQTFLNMRQHTTMQNNTKPQKTTRARPCGVHNLGETMWCTQHKSLCYCILWLGLIALCLWILGGGGWQWWRIDGLMRWWQHRDRHQPRRASCRRRGCGAAAFNLFFLGGRATPQNYFWMGEPHLTIIVGWASHIPKLLFDGRAIPKIIFGMGEPHP